MGSRVANRRASARTVGLGEPVEEGGFAGVGVARQRQRGQRNRAAAPPVEGAAGAHALQFEFDLLDPTGDAAAVGFQLRLARSAGADAAAQPRHLDAAAGKAGQQVIELRQFHLEPALARAGAGCEDVEYQLSAVDNPGSNRFFQVALLGGRELTIEDDDVSRSGANRGGQFGSLAGPDEGSGLRRVARLQHALHHLGAGARRQFRQLVERLFAARRSPTRRRRCATSIPAPPGWRARGRACVAGVCYASDSACTGTVGAPLAMPLETVACELPA